MAFFAFTFLAIGINARFASFKEAGLGRPVVAYALGSLWVIIWGGIVAYFVFGRF